MSEGCEPGLLAIPNPCWRCGKTAETAVAVCPFCRARLGPDPIEGARPATADAGMHPVLKVITAYAGMLLISLAWGLIIHFGERADADHHLGGMAVVEGLDTILVLASALAIGRLLVPKPAVPARIAAWLMAPAALALVLAVNVGYRWILMEFLRAGWIKNALIQPEWSALTVLLIAVQPALVEEWFFRHLALGAVRTATGTHAAVWVAAVMFAVAHVYNPLGLPWLLVAGLVFGYARVASGGLALPVLMHFTHNALILWFQGFV